MKRKSTMSLKNTPKKRSERPSASESHGINLFEQIPTCLENPEAIEEVKKLLERFDEQINETFTNSEELEIMNHETIKQVTAIAMIYGPSLTDELIAMLTLQMAIAGQGFIINMEALHDYKFVMLKTNETRKLTVISESWIRNAQTIEIACAEITLVWEMVKKLSAHHSWKIDMVKTMIGKTWKGKQSDHRKKVKVDMTPEIAIQSPYVNAKQLICSVAFDPGFEPKNDSMSKMGYHVKTAILNELARMEPEEEDKEDYELVGDPSTFDAVMTKMKWKPEWLKHLGTEARFIALAAEQEVYANEIREILDKQNLLNTETDRGSEDTYNC